MMHPRALVVELNGMGMELLRKVRYEASIEAFVDTIRLLQLFARSESYNKACFSEASRVHKDATERMGCEILPSIRPQEAGHEVMLPPEIYAHPIPLRRSSDDQAYNDRELGDGRVDDSVAAFNHNWFEESAVMLYNLALAYHLHGIETGVGASIDKALEIYGLSSEVDLLPASSDAHTPYYTATTSENRTLLPRAILNNAGVIHYDSNCFDASTLCFQTLLSNLHDETTQQRVDSPFYDFFYFNATFMQCPPTTGASAA